MLRPTVQPRPLTELAAVAGTTARSGVAITGVTHDSTAVQPGDLFAAMPGARTHGARFAGQALASGAVAVLTDAQGAAQLATDAEVLVVSDPRSVLGDLAALVYSDSSRVQIAGVTGTNGKTTVAYMLAAGLEAAGHRTGLLGTLGVRIGGEWLPSTRTTPEAPDVHALLAVMAQSGCSHVAMEVSSHALALHRVDGVSFDVSAFTNLARDHLDFHSSIEDYFETKSRLFEPTRSARAVVCVDDEYGRALRDSLSIPSLTVTGSVQDGAEADLWATDVRFTAAGFDCQVVLGDGRQFRLALPIAGDFNLSNALVAVGLLDQLGVNLAAAIPGLAAAANIPGRMEPIDAGQSFTVLVDYAHTPDAVASALSSLRTDPQKVRLVLGCGGDRDAGKRPQMGAAAAAGSGNAWFTSDNPRTEDAAVIVDEMLAGVPPEHRSRVQVELDRARAIRAAIISAQPGDVVLVAGKGHETGQEVNGVVHPFDDRAECRRVLAEVTS